MQNGHVLHVARLSGAILYSVENVMSGQTENALLSKVYYRKAGLSVLCKVHLGEGRVEEEGLLERLQLSAKVSLERVRKFCYLGDMINGDGGASLASVVRVRCAWKKFMELAGNLASKDISLKLKGKVYLACVRSAMVYGCETWGMTVEQMTRFERKEMRMIRWMCGVSKG